MENLDKKFLEVFEGKIVRKDLMHKIKKGTNIPTFVLEFLLAKYCASDSPEEIKAGIEAVLDTLQDNYVRPDESNKAQSKVATKGKYRFIDKVHVRYLEKDKKHWASLENFASQRIAIADKFYNDNERLLQGGLWAEVTVGYNEMDEDDYAFYIEDLRPIQLSRFNFKDYGAGRKEFSRDEWLDLILRSVGLEPSKLTKRLKFHYVARLASLVEANFNFIELGPRGTGKSYFFSEFSPYSTLISGGQATKATLFYNNARKQIGLVGFWDTIAFDEVAGIKVKDPDTIQIMKDYMANGRFSRGAEVIADASLAFVGNIDHSIEQVVKSEEYDLFMPLPKEFDLAVMDRFAAYIPGWEFPKNSSEFLTNNYGFITDYLAEAFHYQLKHRNRYEEVSSKVKLGKSVEGRDEKGIKKTIAAFLKILHPDNEATESELVEYLEYAVECRRRVKEQMNKRKPDDEFANINLSYIDSSGIEKIVYCPESKNASATQTPNKSSNVLDGEGTDKELNTGEEVIKKSEGNGLKAELSEKHYSILYDDVGHTYDSIFLDYMIGAKKLVIEDPYIRVTHQVQNFVRFCETVIKSETIKEVKLITSFDEDTRLSELKEQLEDLKQSLMDRDIKLDIEFNENLHDREVRIDNGWVVKIGRGLDFYQKPSSWFEVGSNDLSLRKCLETNVDIFKV
jgi:ATP-dependent Lon protease